MILFTSSFSLFGIPWRFTKNKSSQSQEEARNSMERKRKTQVTLPSSNKNNVTRHHGWCLRHLLWSRNVCSSLGNGSNGSNELVSSWTAGMVNHGSDTSLQKWGLETGNHPISPFDVCTATQFKLVPHIWQYLISPYLSPYYWEMSWVILHFPKLSPTTLCHSYSTPCWDSQKMDQHDHWISVISVIPAITINGLLSPLSKINQKPPVTKCKQKIV